MLAGLIDSDGHLSKNGGFEFTQKNENLMNDVESFGGAKFDILKVAILSKIMGVSRLLSTGRIDGD